MLGLVPVAGGAKIPLDKAVIFFGRHPECDIRLVSSRKVSRRHCCIAQVNDRWVVRDLGSMNGILLNGEKVEREADLGAGDQLTVGDVAFDLVEVKSVKK
jgi:pSer/pThr/pTyr-binding forkhead associated (FHA) protein